MSRGKKYNDWVIGETIKTSGRTVTESDVTRFAGLSGDFNQLHTDAEFAKANTPYGERIAHGALTFAMATGLMDHSGMIEGVVVGFLGANLKWPAPVLFGDTIHLEVTAIDKKPTKNPKRGIVTLSIKVVNQNDVVVGDEEWTIMFIV